EKLERRLQDSNWQMRTVAVDRDDATEVRDEIFERRNQRGGEPIAALPDDVYARRQTRRDLVHVFRGAHHRHVNASELLSQLDRIAQHAVGELDDVAFWIRTVQPRLHEAFPGSLRHHHHGAAGLFHPINGRCPAHVTRPGSGRFAASRSRCFTMPERMHQAAPIEPLNVPLIFETPMRGWYLPGTSIARYPRIAPRVGSSTGQP